MNFSRTFLNMDKPHLTSPFCVQVMACGFEQFILLVPRGMWPMAPVTWRSWTGWTHGFWGLRTDVVSRYKGTWGEALQSDWVATRGGSQGTRLSLMSRDMCPCALNVLSALPDLAITSLKSETTFQPTLPLSWACCLICVKSFKLLFTGCVLYVLSSLQVLASNANQR